jgi:hypothetical protein
MKGEKVMSDLKNTIGAKEFKQRVKEKLMQKDKSIKEDDLYFSYGRSDYYMEYKPGYPEKTDKDFLVQQDLSGTILVRGSENAAVPETGEYADIDDFEERL